ncbi:PorP/SprF family type IX secretion system membrane protein [Daejeonella oryzae]|uniref:PorP/SprF family type IX secretion system membrane protein n=1 Tax=Daejeonella oryzae TaxID=1122943 RepID=UPI0004091814|nr:type IX secretion system membrane protein PorP/SprF [Daejeonella oryzae]
MCIAAICQAQQDAQFSQYIFNGIYINPAYAGYKEQVYLQSSLRSQWAGVEGAPQTASVAIDGVTDYRRNVGVGLMIAHDRIGAQSSLSAYANYAYRLQVGALESSRLALGLGVGAIQLGIDGTKLRSTETDDQFIPQIKQTTILPDARAGVYFSNENYFAGFSVDNLLAHYMKPKSDTDILTPIPKPHYYLTGGALLVLNPTMKFKPSFLIKDDLAGPSSVDVNAFMLFDERLWVGAFYRTSFSLYNKDYLQRDLQKSSATGIIAEVFATEKLRIAYSFDYSLNKLRNYNYGSHEVSIGIYFGNSRADQPKCYF